MLVVLISPLVLVAVLVVWARWSLLVVTVRGPSMEPTLRDGDRLLVRRRPLARVAVGELVVLAHPAGPDAAFHPAPTGANRGAPTIHSVKRLAGKPGDRVPGSPGEVVPAGRLWLLGDNPGFSADSRVLGSFSADDLVGTVTRALG
ncbi:S26 family signal peptidase [Nonomuraea longicatena]|uniref:S26 family signal peptidase n=1 Tax=Nonomuraea longicatena TaxID=83682 RepID=A0ABN1PII1_9ACTN